MNADNTARFHIGVHLRSSAAQSFFQRPFGHGGTFLLRLSDAMRHIEIGVGKIV
jgi:hypothetical protein